MGPIQKLLNVAQRVIFTNNLFYTKDTAYQHYVRSGCKTYIFIDIRTITESPDKKYIFLFPN